MLRNYSVPTGSMIPLHGQHTQENPTKHTYTPHNTVTGTHIRMRYCSTSILVYVQAQRFTRKRRRPARKSFVFLVELRLTINTEYSSSFSVRILHWTRTSYYFFFFLTSNRSNRIACNHRDLLSIKRHNQRYSQYTILINYDFISFLQCKNCHAPSLTRRRIRTKQNKTTTKNITLNSCDLLIPTLYLICWLDCYPTLSLYFVR